MKSLSPLLSKGEVFVMFSSEFFLFPDSYLIENDVRIIKCDSCPRLSLDLLDLFSLS